jgi:hypothetical protein
MSDQGTGPGGTSSTARISEAVAVIWGKYSDGRPRSIQTEIHGDVVICRLFDAVGSFNEGLSAPGSYLTRPTLADYKRDMIAAVVGVTRQQVKSFESSHDRDTDIATEVITLERGSRRAPTRSE